MRLANEVEADPCLRLIWDLLFFLRPGFTVPKAFQCVVEFYEPPFPTNRGAWKTYTHGKLPNSEQIEIFYGISGTFPGQGGNRG